MHREHRFRWCTENVAWERERMKDEGEAFSTQQSPISKTNLLQRVTIFHMDWKILGTAFITIFLAELGDKTQLAIITMSANTESKVAVFIGASLALVIVSLLAVLVGGVLTQVIPTEWLQRIVAVAFIAIGVLMLAGIL